MAEKTIHLKRTSLYASGASPVNMIQAIFYPGSVWLLTIISTARMESTTHPQYT